MKKLFILTLLTVIFVVGCKKESKEPEQKITSNQIDTVNIQLIKINEDVSLLYDLPVNSTIRYKFTSYQKNTQSILLDSAITGFVEQKVDYIFKLTVKEKENNGNMDLNIQCEDIKAIISSSNGEKVTFDAANPPVDSLTKMQTKNFAILAGVNFSARVSPTGDVIDVYRSDEIINRIISGAPRKPSEEEKLALKKDVELGILKPIVEQILKNTTEKKVNLDSMWTKTYSTPVSVFDIQNTATYKVTKIFESNNNKLVEITGSLTTVSTGKTDYTENNIKYKFQKPRVSGSSKMYFDLNKKCIRSASSNVSIELTMDMQEIGKPKVYKRTDKIETRNTLTLFD